MAVNLLVPEQLAAVPGIRLATAAAQIKNWQRDDVLLIEIAEGASVAGVFTQNRFCAAPVLLARAHLQQTTPRYLLVNAGNANAGTGEPGMLAARQCCAAVAAASACQAEQVLPFSTGVIGEPLPVAKIEAVQASLQAGLDADNWMAASRAIMTTDTLAKGISRHLSLQGKTITITGIAKGAGMIRPDMATMLAYIATDCGVAAPLLQEALQQAVDKSFNRITVDGDTSTNDSCILMATGAAGVMLNSAGDEGYSAFLQGLQDVLQFLAQAMVRDGEGATKFITINVGGGRDSTECLEVAYTIAHSPLVKTAFFASDPNWGRILAAVGRAHIDDLALEALEIFLGPVRIVSQGGRDPGYREEDGQRVMDQSEITIRVELHRGDAQEQVWTSDLSYDYVKINADYRT